MPLPEYRDNSIVNLMSGIESALGGGGEYAPLATLDLDALSGARSVVLLVIDGLGYHYLDEAGSGGFLARHAGAPITTVFPATTAAAITTFLTARAPQQHAHTGWFTYFEELGLVAAGLPFVSRGRNKPLPRRKLGELFDASPLFPRLSRRSFVLSPEWIAHSSFNRHFSRGAEIVPYRNLADMLGLLGQLCQRPQPKYVYAYWPELDRLGHEFGMRSEPAQRHLRELDRALADFASRQRGSDSLLLVTADHGFVDPGAGQSLWLEDFPELASGLRQPLCGEPRAAYCYLSTPEAGAFMAAAQAALGGALNARPSAELIDAGYFGIGTPSPRLAARVGDVTLLAEDGYCIRDRVDGERAHRQLGVHGGVSAAELYVPLVSVPL